MGLLSAFDQAIRAGDPVPGDDRLFSGNEMPSISYAGIPVTTRSALGNHTFWKCIRWRASIFGMLPKKVFERVEIKGRSANREAREHPLYDLIHRRPNPLMSSMRFFGLMQQDLYTEGNFYAFIQRDRSTTEVSGLWRLRPSAAWMRTEIERYGQNRQQWRIWYYWLDDQGREHKFYPDEIFHVPLNLSGNGVTGYSPIRIGMMQLLGWSDAAQRYGSQFFKNASRHSGFLIAENGIDPDKKDEVLASIQARGRNAGALAVLEGGWKYQQYTMTQDEAQFLETLQDQDEWICGAVNVKPHKVGIMRNMTNNNVEQQNIEAMTDSIQPDCVLSEQEMDRQLIIPDQQDRIFTQNEMKAMLRGDTAAQTAHIIAMRDRAIYDGNDCAEYLGNPPFEGGEIRVINRAYGPLEDIHEWSMESQNNPPARERETGKANAEHLRPLFRDAVGRVISRKKKEERPKAAEALFAPILMAIAGALFVPADSGFMTRYLAAMGQRAADWTDADVCTAEEFERAIAAFKTEED